MGSEREVVMADPLEGSVNGETSESNNPTNDNKPLPEIRHGKKGADGLEIIHGSMAGHGS